MASMKFSEASSSLSQSYQVFVSFRGPDTRYSFTDFLYTLLEEKGYQVFRDKEGIKCGETIQSTLQVVIRESKLSIVVLSKDYGSSKWCLDELVTIMHRHEKEGHPVCPVFYDVDPSDVRNQRGSFHESFVEHEELYKDKRDRVEDWRAALRKVGELRGEVVKEERYWSEVIKNIVQDVERLIGKEGIIGVEKRKYAFPVPELVGEGFERASESIWSLLKKDEVARIGVYGMGGIGKTTLMMHIHNQLLKEPQDFRHIYWVTASQDCDIHRLQNRIAKIIKLDISDEEDEMYRAAKLAYELARKGSFVLIIDDLWKYFDLEEVGLPPKDNGYKLIFTTRSLEVCKQMDCQENIIKVEPLSPKEAWVLFKSELGAYNINIKVEAQAKEIVRECAGLPLAVKTIGRSMKGVDDEFEWRNALDQMKDPKVGKSHMDPVFQLLRFSYSRLNDSSLQQCLLYCALFPEDFVIRREELIEFLIVEGIIEKRKYRREEVDKGQVMISKLVNASLLEHDGDTDRYVKMHDVIRDMALQILRGESSVIVETGKQLTECPDEDEWERSLARVSLMRNNIREIGSNLSPVCPNLSTLLLCRNKLLEKISNCFFERLNGLKVLDLSGTRIEILPESISNLVSLSALFLRECYKLRHVPSLATLIALEELDLRGCGLIEEVPHGMELLRKLRYLDLRNCRKLKEFPAGMLPNLSRLQVLRIHKDLKGQEMGCLKKLEELVCSFPNLVEFNKYLRSAKPPHKFQIDVNSNYMKDLEVNKYLKLSGCDISREGDFHKLPEGIEMLQFHNCKLSDRFVLNDASELKSIVIFSCEEVQCLTSVSGLSANIFSRLEEICLYDLSSLRSLVSRKENENGDPLALPSTQTFARLKTIKIMKCHNIKKLLPRGLLRNLQNLMEIEVCNCDGVKEIVGNDEENSTDYSSHLVTLPKLRQLALCRLPSLESIYGGKLICESLRFIQFEECRMLKRIPISLPHPSLCYIKVGQRDWWEQVVEWDPPDAKKMVNVGPFSDNFRGSN